MAHNATCTIMLRFHYNILQILASRFLKRPTVSALTNSFVSFTSTQTLTHFLHAYAYASFVNLYQNRGRLIRTHFVRISSHIWLLYIRLKKVNVIEVNTLLVLTVNHSFNPKEFLYVMRHARSDQMGGNSTGVPDLIADKQHITNYHLCVNSLLSSLFGKNAYERRQRAISSLPRQNIGSQVRIAFDG